MEHPSLPAAEAQALLELLGAPVREVEVEAPGVLLVEVDVNGVRGEGEGSRVGSEVGAGLVGAFAERVGLTHRVLSPAVVVEDAPSVEAIVEAVEGVDPGVLVPQGASFAVRVRRLGGARGGFDSEAVARGVGEVVSGAGRAVDLSDPMVEVRVLVGEDVAVVGQVLAEVDRGAFEARHVEKRPFFSPVSLHPRHARALVNLAQVGVGERVLDPFVGTGGLALEVGLVGGRVVASDLDARMVAGTERVLEHFGVEPLAVRVSDVGDVPGWLGEVGEGAGGVGLVAAVVTDPPYGRASTTAREDLAALYRRFLDVAAEVVAPGGRVATVFPGQGHVDDAAAHDAFTLEQHHVQPVHRSLERHWVVLERTHADL